jgi:hypothetical protein
LNQREIFRKNPKRVNINGGVTMNTIEVETVDLLDRGADVGCFELLHRQGMAI